MTSKPPPREPTLEERIHMTDSFTKLVHNISIGTLIVAPLLISLPPRKLDLYTFFLSSAMVASANQLVKERTGAGLIYQLPGARLPSYAIEYQERRGRRLSEEPVSVRETVRKYSTKEGWKEQRLREEQEKLDQGEGYGGMIVDQIWDVWNQAEKKAEDIKQKDEEVLKEDKKT